MMEFALYLTAVGMGGVFLVLSILASLMRVLGKVLGSKSESKPEFGPSANSNSSSAYNGGLFTEKELAAIAAAIVRYESSDLPRIAVSESWKRYARIYAVRWSN